MLIRAALVLSYAVFAILLNSVGTVILQAIETWGVTKAQASTLEGFKDIPIAIASFLVASFLPRFGLKRGMMVALSAVALGCLVMPLLDSFSATRLLFVIVGVSFAVIKVATYAAVGLLTRTPDEHGRLLNFIEGSFMLAVLAGYWLFSLFIDPVDPASPRWLQVYWLLAALSVAALVALAFAKLDETEAKSKVERSPLKDFGAMLRLAARPLTLVFVGSLFFYVLVEQGIGTWLPTFNRELLGLSAPMSVQAASIFALGLAVGRLLASAVMARVGWFPLLLVCLAAMAALILAVLPLAEAARGQEITRWSQAPAAAFLLPLIGVAMAPLYPVLNSAVLSVLPKPSHAPMVGLIVVFSALGGTTGSLVIGSVFGASGDTAGFYLLLLPIVALFIIVVILRGMVAKASVHGGVEAADQPGTTASQG